MSVPLIRIAEVCSAGFTSSHSQTVKFAGCSTTDAEMIFFGGIWGIQTPPPPEHYLGHKSQKVQMIVFLELA